jgi:hypothetical protein
VELLVAANCALLPSVFVPYAPVGLACGVFGILPMANILAITCYRNLSRRTAGRPFFVGFALTGALFVVGWFNFCMTADEKRLTAFNNWIYGTLTAIPFVLDMALSIDPRNCVYIYKYILL